jgi:hypothetical protein
MSFVIVVFPSSQNDFELHGSQILGYANAIIKPVEKTSQLETSKENPLFSSGPAASDGTLPSSPPTKPSQVFKKRQRDPDDQPGQPTGQDTDMGKDEQGAAMLPTPPKKPKPTEIDDPSGDLIARGGGHGGDIGDLIARGGGHGGDNLDSDDGGAQSHPARGDNKAIGGAGFVIGGAGFAGQPAGNLAGTALPVGGNDASAVAGNPAAGLGGAVGTPIHNANTALPPQPAPPVPDFYIDGKKRSKSTVTMEQFKQCLTYAEDWLTEKHKSRYRDLAVYKQTSGGGIKEFLLDENFMQRFYDLWKDGARNIRNKLGANQRGVAMALHLLSLFYK